jgi:hypothetical protein
VEGRRERARETGEKFIHLPEKRRIDLSSLLKFLFKLLTKRV